MRPTKLVMMVPLLLAACAVEPLPGDAQWSVDHVVEDGVTLSVWGAGPDDVWAVGGQVGEGLLLHNDGTGWIRQDVPDATELLNWVYGFKDDDVYAVGEGGLILHYDGTRWQRVESGTDQMLYGIWGSSSGDVWIVGGDPAGSPGAAVVLRGQGTDFRPVDVPDELRPSALFKIYGYHDEVLAVGSQGTVLRFSADTWHRDEVPTQAPLFSMWGRQDGSVYAVGGYDTGELLHFDGERWQRTEDVFAPGLSGVFTAPGYPLIAVGLDAYVIEIDQDGLVREPELPALGSRPALHGVWGDEAGTVYAVGGDIASYPGPMGGVIFRRQ